MFEVFQVTQAGSAATAQWRALRGFSTFEAAEGYARSWFGDSARKRAFASMRVRRPDGTVVEVVRGQV